jgi:26S proteasome regulatory subunit N12
MDAIEVQFASLEQIINSAGALDVRRAESLITDLKIALLTFQSLTPNSPEASVESRVRFRNLLEYDALISIRTRNLDEFDRAMAQLKCYYFRETNLPTSARMPLLLSVHLVRILALKKLVDFNIELQLARTVIGSNEYIDYAADLHQSIIENSFSRLFSLEGRPPSPLFTTFIADLLNGARDNYADSIEHAYVQLPIDELALILRFNSIDEARQFVAKREWPVSDDGMTVGFLALGEGKGRAPVDMLARSVDLSIQISALA